MPLISLFLKILAYLILHISWFIYFCFRIIHLLSWIEIIGFIINLCLHYLNLGSFILWIQNEDRNKLTVKILLVDEHNWIGILLLWTNLKMAITKRNELIKKLILGRTIVLVKKIIATTSVWQVLLAHHLISLRMQWKLPFWLYQIIILRLHSKIIKIKSTSKTYSKSFILLYLQSLRP